MDRLALDPIPALVDGMDDAANEAFLAWPERLYLLARDGKVAYRGDPGPMGFDPDEWAQAIEAHLALDAADPRP